ncbi:peptidoglycan-binding protein [Oscillibacter sp.]|uniref:peptidoglycan-binding protein n=1 Tax=Oscillibacter sp. TaxID=1945593 RepID=UPI002D7E577A|nr:peptidoglycan-binding protein [Oscillibacter sp.]
MNPTYTDKGSLQIFVTAGESPDPIPGARVRVTDPADGTVLEELATDASGQTPFIELPTPPMEWSVEEGAAEQRPYAVYNVTVFAPERETLHLGGVELLPAGRAIQRAPLAPARSGGFNVHNVLLAPHALWGEPSSRPEEAEVKPLPEPEGLVVLPEPVIPEFVVVHDGRPDDASAQNYWVRFKDYVKNVACSEIYSTWRTETIKANVLAIISFTLNRVYTEWYRGKGYDFTVTSSTAFDQSYSHGRTLFEEIGVVVDDLFTTYVTKEGIAQPLFTQYCDGRRTQCSGLSQWGSQALGEQGWDAVSILKKYYGSEIYLKSAEKVEGVPLSYGGEVLTLGSEGEAVRTIQSQLNRIADNFPAIPKTPADGVYGPATQAAVTEFQKIFHLPQTGSVDFAAWYEISNVFVAVSKMA